MQVSNEVDSSGNVDYEIVQVQNCHAVANFLAWNGALLLCEYCCDASHDDGVCFRNKAENTVQYHRREKKRFY